MNNRTKVALTAALLVAGTLAIAGRPQAVGAETHSNCATFDANGHVIGFTPSCSETVHAAPSSSVSPGVNPCTDAPGTVVTNIDRSVLHINVNGAGDAWLTGTVGGTASFTADSPSDPSGQGTWTEWFGDQLNNQSFVSGSTMTDRFRLSDGSHLVIHDNTQTRVTTDGVTTTFDHPTLRCNG